MLLLFTSSCLFIAFAIVTSEFLINLSFCSVAYKTFPTSYIPIPKAVIANLCISTCNADTLIPIHTPLQLDAYLSQWVRLSLFSDRHNAYGYVFSLQHFINSSSCNSMLSFIN